MMYYALVETRCVAPKTTDIRTDAPAMLSFMVESI